MAEVEELAGAIGVAEEGVAAVAFAEEKRIEFAEHFDELVFFAGIGFEDGEGEDLVVHSVSFLAAGGSVSSGGRSSSLSVPTTCSRMKLVEPLEDRVPATTPMISPAAT